MAQAEDRICRIGQDRGCVYTSLMANHALDYVVERALERKRQLIDDTVERVADTYTPLSVRLRKVFEMAS